VVADASDASVLLVDDEEALVSLYESYLSDRYDVTTATGGHEALEVADDSLDVVLLDRRMPEMCGEEVLRGLRDSGVDCRVAMLTAVEPTADIVDMPFDDYRVKPVEQPELIGLVELLTERANYNDASQRYFALASKKAALEVAGEESTEEYERILSELETARETVDASLDSVGAKAAFSDLP